LQDGGLTFTQKLLESKYMKKLIALYFVFAVAPVFAGAGHRCTDDLYPSWRGNAEKYQTHKRCVGPSCNYNYDLPNEDPVFFPCFREGYCHTYVPYNPQALRTKRDNLPPRYLSKEDRYDPRALKRFRKFYEKKKCAAGNC